MDRIDFAEQIGALKGALSLARAQADHYRSETMALRKERRELKRKIRELKRSSR